MITILQTLTHHVQEVCPVFNTEFISQLQVFTVSHGPQDLSDPHTAGLGEGEDYQVTRPELEVIEGPCKLPVTEQKGES